MATMSQVEFTRKLQRFDIRAEVIREITAQLAVPIDLDRDRAVLDR